MYVLRVGDGEILQEKERERRRGVIYKASARYTEEQRDNNVKEERRMTERWFGFAEELN
jgi:hypothetical protein